MQLFDLLLNIEGLIFRKSSLSQAVLLLWKVFFSVSGETLPNLVNDINIKKTQSVRGGIWQSVWPCGAALCCLCTQVGYFWLRTKPNSTTAPLPLYKWGQWGVADIFIAATWGRDQRRWMSKTCKTTFYGPGALLLWNIHPPNSDLCQPNRQSLQIVGDKDATLIRDAGWWTINI